MKQIVLTLIGQTKLNLVEKLATVILEHGGIWTSSFLNEIEGYLTGALSIEVPKKNLLALTTAIYDIQDLDVKIHQGILSPATQKRQLKLVVVDNHKPEIVRDIAAILHLHKARLINFETRKQKPTMWGVSLFSAAATIELPEGVSPSLVINALQTIDPTIIVEVEK